MGGVMKTVEIRAQMVEKQYWLDIKTPDQRGGEHGIILKKSKNPIKVHEMNLIEAGMNAAFQLLGLDCKAVLTLGMGSVRMLKVGERLLGD